MSLSLALWLPLSLAVLAGLSAGRVQRRLPPRLAAPLLTIAAAGCALAVLWGLAIVAFGFLAPVPVIAEIGGWCHRVFPSDDRIAVPLGIASLAALGLSIVSVGRARRAMRRLLHVMAATDDQVEILDLDTPTAFAVPGKPGHIVVSQAMLDCLDERDRAVLFAHEQAHLDHAHHRYVRVADLAASAVPILRPIAAQVRFATERWADEIAVDAVGDRDVVAHAIARAALAVSAAPPLLTLGIAGDVPGRVEALLRPPRHSPWLTAGSSAVLGLSVFVVLAASTLQLHHFLAYATHVCRI